MHIVHIEDFFHPEAGYQLNIISKYMVHMGHKVSIITACLDKVPQSLTSFFERENIEKKDLEFCKKYGVGIFRIPLMGFVSGRAIFSKKIFEKILELNPDVVYVHGNDTLTAMRYLLLRKRMNYPYLMDNHMLEMASNNRFRKVFRAFYKFFFTPIIVKENIQVIRTQNDPYVQNHLGIPLVQAPWISVGSDTMLFHPDAIGKKKFRKENAIDEDAFVVLYAGKLDESKGGKILAHAIRDGFDISREIVFVIVGNTIGTYGADVENEFGRSSNRILRFPTQKYVDLPAFYQGADIVVFPRQCSLSFYDAQACGLPVVFENNSINVERAKYGNACTFRAGDAVDLREKIIQMAKLDKSYYCEMAKNGVSLVQNFYDYKDISKRYMELIEQAVKQYGLLKD